jgi:hypothetical protein
LLFPCLVIQGCTVVIVILNSPMVFTTFSCLICASRFNIEGWAFTVIIAFMDIMLYVQFNKVWGLYSNINFFLTPWCSSTSEQKNLMYYKEMGNTIYWVFSSLVSYFLIMSMRLRLMTLNNHPVATVSVGPFNFWRYPELLQFMRWGTSCLHASLYN